MTTVTLNGNTYNDTSTPPLNMGNGGHRANMFPMLSDAVVDLAAKQSASAASAAAALVSQNAAAASAATAVSAATGFVGTSTTSLLIAVASKVFTTQAGEMYTAGIWVQATSAANNANWMYGQVTSYTGTTLTVDVQVIGGSGTYADWNISLAGARGAAGAGVPANLTLTNPATAATVTIASGSSLITAGAYSVTLTATATTDVTLPAGTVTLAQLGANVFTGQQTFVETMDTVHTITDGAAFEIDPVNGSVQIVTLGASRTPAATNFAAGQTVILGIDDGTAYSITWTTVAPVWVKAGGTGAAPTLAATGYTWVLLWKVGAVMYAAEVGKP